MNYCIPKAQTRVTQILSDYAYDLKYEDIPSEVIEHAKMILLQVIGVSLATKNHPEVEKVISIAREANGGIGGEATAWLTGDKLSAANAAMVNGTLADMLDWEDTSWTGHPSAGIIPVAWLVSETLRKSGKDLLTAIVAGYEVYQRIAMAIQPSAAAQQHKGWGLTSWQIFGCIIPAVKLMGLTPMQINQAIGLGTACSTIPASFHDTCMSEFYHYEHGLRARDGIMIAEMVKSGINGCMDSLDIKEAYDNVITDTQSPEWYTKDLGSRYLIMTPLLKHWPANMWVQTPVEIAHDIVVKHNIKPEDIKEIFIDPPKEGRMDQPPNEGFKALTHAQFSMPYVVSAVIHEHEPSARWYLPEMMQNPSVISLAQRVYPGKSEKERIGVSFKMFQQGSFPKRTLTINTYDGRSFTSTMDCQLGHPANMMSREQFVERFRIQAKDVFSAAKMEEAIEALCDIENCSDISTLSSYVHE